MLLVDQVVGLLLTHLIGLIHRFQIRRNATGYDVTSTKGCPYFSNMHLRLSKLRSIYMPWSNEQKPFAKKIGLLTGL